jgi:NAD(P)H-nitrite reductase large subunit
MKTRYVIIGSGAAGIAAAETLLDADPACRVCIISPDPHGYYSRPGLAYYLAREIDESQLFPFHLNTWGQKSVEWIKSSAVRLNPAARWVHLQDGQTVLYDRLLLAPGATAILPDLPGIHLAGVVKLDTLEDTRQILKLARRGAEAVVVGGGITALELVEGLAASGMRVHYLLRGERYWSNILDPEESRMVEAHLKEDGIIIHTQTQVSEIVGKRNVEGVRTQDGQIIPCRLLAFAVGIRPRLELAAGAGLVVKRGIRVNEYLQTSDPCIYAAGDAAEMIDPLSGEGILESLWNPAMQQGHAAARNMLGANEIYRRSSAVNVTRLAGLITTIIGQVGEAKNAPDRDLKGIMRGDSEVWRQSADAMIAKSYTNGSRVRLFVGQKTLRGALVMGEQTLSRPLQHLIENEVDITPIRPALLEPGADLVQIIRDYDRQYLMTMVHHLENSAGS